MLAAWYDRQGAAADVLQVGELPDPQPAAGEVRVRLAVSGVNPDDTKKRDGWVGNPMLFPRVIPHSDGAGVIDAVVAVYASRANRPEVPLWPLLFANTTLRMMGSDDFSTSAKAIAVQ
jgi:NADPH:quinone reductase-like Zn-dependent oxidoreductase